MKGRRRFSAEEFNAWVVWDAWSRRGFFRHDRLVFERRDTATDRRTE